MTPSTFWVIVVFAAIVALAVLLRRRYGNIYEGLKGAVEGSTGWSLAAIGRGLGIATLLAWGAVYLLFGSDQQTGLDQLFKSVLGGGDGAVD